MEMNNRIGGENNGLYFKLIALITVAFCLHPIHLDVI